MSGNTNGWRADLNQSGAALASLAGIFLATLATPVSAYDPLAGDFSKANPLDVRVMAYNTKGSFIVNSGSDPEFNRILTAINPDAICFEEIPVSLTAVQIAARLNTIMPIGGAGWQVHFGILAGTRNAIASRYPLALTRTDTLPASSTRGVTIALIDLPNANYPLDLYLLGVHLKCCGDPGGTEDESRQRSADAIVNWLGDARGVVRPSGNNIVLPANTPMMVLGDFNLVGGPQPESTLITGNIQDEATFGADVQGDWDVTNVTDLAPVNPFNGSNITWQGSTSFPPSRLDRMFFTDSAVVVANSFVLNTNTMTPAALAAAGLQAGDTLEANSSDHLPIVADLRIAACADSDGDGVCNNADGCPNDPNKTAPGICGCDVADTDSDGDGTPNCVDQCPADPNKSLPGQCGCGTADTDSDNDGTANCSDGCPNDPSKITPGICGCGTADTDSDGDGAPNCTDGCPADANKTAPGTCGCGVSDDDSDNDGTPNCTDGCPGDTNKIVPGLCGCGVSDVDSDSDGTPNCNDACVDDPAKIAPGICGCGVSDANSDGDGMADCLDGCPADPLKTSPGRCGCGIVDTPADGDLNSDGLVDANDLPQFIEGVLDQAATPDIVCHGDFSGDLVVSPLDIDGMVVALVSQP